MKFKAAPIDFDIELFFQPDQTGSLRDIAERSDKIGIELQDETLLTHHFSPALSVGLSYHCTAVVTAKLPTWRTGSSFVENPSHPSHYL
ncbi:MAG: hypothetical protein HYX80_05600 [Chloroflexi bacterium]|nr:hypothetical protein [Chloroflexota bacterium]